MTEEGGVSRVSGASTWEMASGAVASGRLTSEEEERGDDALEGGDGEGRMGEELGGKVHAGRRVEHSRDGAVRLGLQGEADGEVGALPHAADLGRGRVELDREGDGGVGLGGEDVAALGAVGVGEEEVVEGGLVAEAEDGAGGDGGRLALEGVAAEDVEDHAVDAEHLGAPRWGGAGGIGGELGKGRVTRVGDEALAAVVGGRSVDEGVAHFGAGFGSACGDSFDGLSWRLRVVFVVWIDCESSLKPLIH